MTGHRGATSGTGGGDPAGDSAGNPAGLDPATLARLQHGDPATLQRLLRPELPALLALARRLCSDPHWAEDLVQEVLVRACQGVAGFRGESSLRTWLFRILVRLAGQTRRWRDRGPAAERLEPTVPDALGREPELQTRERELAERLDEAMERLTRKQRTALHLRAVEGLDYRAIAAVLGGSSAAARMLVLAARRQVMHRMGRHLSP